MKTILLTLFISIISFNCYAAVIEGAYEAGTIKIEYYDTSKTGNVFVTQCGHCNKAIYNFKQIPIINVDNVQIPLTEYLKSPKKYGFGTIVIDVLTDTVIRINF